MELMLIRHAKAEDHGHPMGDGARALTEKGRMQSAKVGAFLEENGWVPDLILTSPLVRARETAEIVAETSGADAPVLQEWLACGMAPEEALQELAAYDTTCRRVAIVGHEPDFSSLIGHIMGSRHSWVRVKKASVILLRIDPPRPGGVMEFNIWPKMLPER
jgi:phosphohistidine phosphatase